MRLFLSVFLFLWLVAGLYGQSLSNKREKTLTFYNDTLQLDSQSVFTDGLKFTPVKDTAALPLTDFFIDYGRARVYLKNNALRGKQIKVTYKAMPFNFTKDYALKQPPRMENIFLGPHASEYEYTPGSLQSLVQESELSKQGSFARGISFGNGQDLALNSSLDLQLSGKLTNDVTILAALTDRNVPVQPDGTTAQLQDFDNVFIQITFPRQKFILGDFLMANDPNNYFLKFNNKAEGLFAQTLWITEQHDTGHSGGSVSISKGEYRRQTFNGQDGDQGPYLLNGNSGEQYVVVLANTEKIYIDGNLMKRGELNDYIIDYNAGQVTFTPNRPITQYNRIVIEFQYSTQSYTRTVVHAFTDFKYEQWKFAINLYSAQDNKNQTVAGGPPDSTTQRILAKAGDSLSKAFTSGVTNSGYSATRVNYKRVINPPGFTGVIYQYSNSSDSAIYTISFTQLGQGQGNYVMLNTSANGQVFGFVPPVKGVMQGIYDTVIKVVAPNKQQMATVSATRSFANKGLAGAELSGSNTDMNTLSSLDKQNDAGWAGHFFIQQQFALQQSKNPFTFSYKIEFEHEDKNFTYIERYRSVEFDRTWSDGLKNPTTTPPRTMQNLGDATFTLAKKGLFNLSTLGQYYTEAGYLNGFMQNANLEVDYQKFILKSLSQVTWVDNLTQPVLDFQNERFEKYIDDLSYPIALGRIGVGWNEEQSAYSYLGHTILDTGVSYKYDEERAYFTNSEKAKHQYTFEIDERNDYSPMGNSESPAARGINYIAKYSVLKNPNKQLRFDFNYRTFDSVRPVSAMDKHDQSFTSRVDYQLNLFHGALATSSYYQISTGKELKNNYVYVPAPGGPGTGNYQWIDFNHNGIAEYNEFVPAVYSDQGDYIKLAVPTSDYVSTVNNDFQQTINLMPGKLFAKDSKKEKFFKRITDNASVQISRKIDDVAQLKDLNPFFINEADTALVSSASLMRNSLYFNKADPIWGADFSVSETRTKTLLTDGIESNEKLDYTAHMRWNFSKKLTLQPVFDWGIKSYSNTFVDTNNYRVYFYQPGCALVYQPTQKLRFNLSYSFSNEQNQEGQYHELGIINNGGLEGQYNWVSKATANIRFNYIHIQYPYNETSPVGYQILQGLQPGSNYTWSVIWNQRLQNNLQLTLNYEGRASEVNAPVHTGKVNVTYIF